MSDIRFIQAQGDLLDAAIAEASRRRPMTPLMRLRSRLRPRKTLAVVVVALVVAGCGVAAATGVFSSGDRTVIGMVDCYYGTAVGGSGANVSGDSDALVIGATLFAGQTPSALCRQRFDGYSASALKSGGLRPVRNPRLVSCLQNATTAAVFIASGVADQCQQSGFSPLPRSFADVSAVRGLAAQLRELYLSRDCWQPRAFARVARSTLVRYGFNDWRVVFEKESSKTLTMIGGRCAVLPPSNPRGGAVYQPLDGVNRTLDLDRGIPRSTNALVDRVDKELSAAAWSRCYSARGLRKLVDHAFASSGMAPRIAVTANPDASPGFSWGTKAESLHFGRGCPVLESSWPTIDDRAVLVWFIARNGTRIRGGGVNPPLSAFHS
jgi:hypothetical protein